MNVALKHTFKILEYSLLAGGIGIAMLIVCLPPFWILGFSWESSTSPNLLSLLFGAPVLVFLFPAAILFWLGISGTGGIILGVVLVPLFWGAVAYGTRCLYQRLRLVSVQSPEKQQKRP